MTPVKLVAPWLDMWELSAALHLTRRGARAWVRRHVPLESTRRDGRQLFVSLSGLIRGLAKCVWRPDLHQPRGYQGDPKARPLNLSKRDARGKFVSNHRDERPPKRKGFVHPTRRRYIKQTD